MCSATEQAFLQSMLSRGALNAEDTRDLYRQIVAVEGDTSRAGLQQRFAQFVLLLNKQLEPLGFKLCRARLEDAEEYWYAIVNRKPDTAAKIGSKFNAQELEFFNKAVKLLVLNEGVVSSAELLNLPCEMERKMAAEAAQRFLKTVVKEHWLSECEGKFSAGPRFILELRPFLSEIYGEEIALCQMCNEPVIRGQQCEDCGVKVHLLCIAKLARGRTVIHCPGCRETWSHDIPDIQLPTTSVPTEDERPPPAKHSAKHSRTSKRH